MVDDVTPSRARGRARKPRTPAVKPPVRTAAAAPSGGKRARRSGAAAGVAPSNGSPEPAPPVFDRLVADDGFVRDFDRLASNNPKSAVLTALAVGVAVGFVAGLLIARD